MPHVFCRITRILVFVLLPLFCSAEYIIDGDIDPEIAGGHVALLTASPVDGPGPNEGGPPTADWGANGSLIELYGGIDGQNVYIAVRGDLFGEDNGNNNATVVLINVDPGAATGAIGSGDLSDTTGIRNRATMQSADDWFTFANNGAMGDGFDAAVIVNAAFGDWEAVGWAPWVGSGAGTPAVFETLAGVQYGYDTSVTSPTGRIAADGTFALGSGVGENAFEILIPRAQLGIGSQTGGNIEIAVYTCSDNVEHINPNTLPENADESYDGLTDFDGMTQQIPGGVPSCAILGPIPSPATVFDVVIDFSTDSVIVNSVSIAGTGTAGATIDVTTDISGNSVSTTVGQGAPGDWTVALPNPLVDGDIVTAEDAANMKTDTKQAVAGDISLRQPPAGGTTVTGTAQGGATVQVEINGAVAGTTTAGPPLSVGLQPYTFTTAAALAFKDIITATDITNTATGDRTATAMAGIDGDLSDLVSVLGATELAVQTVATGFGDNLNQLDNVYCGVVGDSLIIGIGGNIEGGNSFVLYFNTDKGNDTGNDTVAAGTFASPVLDDIILPFYPEYGFLISNIYGRRAKLETPGGATLFDGEFTGAWPNDATSDFEDQVWTDTPYGMFAVAYRDLNDNTSPPAPGVTTRYGFEICIPFAAIGYPSTLEIVAGIDNGEGTWFSNQSLPPMNPGTGNLGPGTADLAGNGVAAGLDLPCLPSIVVSPEFLGISALPLGSVRIEWKALQDGMTTLEAADPFVVPRVWEIIFTDDATAGQSFTHDDTAEVNRRIYRAGQQP